MFVGTQIVLYDIFCTLIFSLSTLLDVSYNFSMEGLTYLSHPFFKVILKILKQNQMHRKCVM